MGKTVEEICDLLAKNNKFSPEISRKSNMREKTLCACIHINNPSQTKYIPLYNNDGFYNSLERMITIELAESIDQNSPERIKYLKDKYGHLKEFSNAKKFLNQKCKEVWNVYEPIKNIPKVAMKALGITNQPELDFLLEHSVKFYEKNNADTTATIIDNILKNQYMNYDINDIHSYLKNMHLKYKCKYNSITVKYLIEKQNYSKQQLIDLGIEENIIKTVLKDIPLKDRLKYDIQDISSKLKFINKIVQK